MHYFNWYFAFTLISSFILSATQVHAQKVNFREERAMEDGPSRVERTKRLLTKPMELNVWMPKDNPLPENLKKYLTGTRPGLRHFTIARNDLAAQTTALATRDIHVELSRPKIAPPEVVWSVFNLESRISHRVPQFEATFGSQKGKTIAAAVFDGGQVRASHSEFQDGTSSRITVRTTNPLDAHSTHVAGTICAKGVNLSAMGMARELRLFSYDFAGDDLNQLDTDAESFQVSNHSYGPISGWHPRGPFGNVWHWWGGSNKTEDPKFGKYTSQEATLDEILFRHKNLVTFIAAGNDRGQSQRGPVNQPVGHIAIVVTPSGLQGESSDLVRSRDGGETGLDTVTGYGLSKNALCIGAVEDIAPEGTNATIQITSFSAFGPADDGRIKPDLVANGFLLFSTAESGDTDYAEMSGTSMACPTACGIGALLWEHFKKVKDRPPTSAEIKAIMIHSARDAGVIGPDPIYGWGAIDALQAGRIISSQSGATVGDPTTNLVTQTTPKKYSFTANGDPIRVTIAWLDPAGAPNEGGVDDPTSALKNDIDVQLKGPDQSQFLPYSFDLANVWNAATNGPSLARKDRANRVDNVEVVDAPTNPGTWEVTVSSHQLRVGDSQDFAMVVSGLNALTP
jgi:subtilisin family serine protease